MRIFAVASALLFTSIFASVGFAQDSTNQTTDSVVQKAQELESKLNSSDTVKEISAGLLQPIYDLAQYMAHPWFYWAAFAVMATGVVSFALQLVLTKFLLLVRMKMSMTEILSDGLGLLISLTGLVLVTQAAAQNSTFTGSPAAVVSAAAVGLIVGFVFYLWGQKTEFKAAKDAKIIQQDSRPRM